MECTHGPDDPDWRLWERKFVNLIRVKRNPLRYIKNKEMREREGLRYRKRRPQNDRNEGP